VRLLVIVNVFNPDRGGGGAIFSDLCYGLAAKGHDVTVRCAYPYYPEWRDKSGRNGLRTWRYDENGVHVERYGIYVPRNPHSLAERLVYEASFFVSLLRSLPRGRAFDAVMVYCPLVGAVAFATLNKWLWRRPLWLNVQDLSADAAAASGIARGKWVKKTLGAVQHLLFNRADVWSSISPVMIRRLEAIRSRNQPIHYLPNWLNGSMADEIAKLPSKIGRAPQAELKLLYAGNIGGKQDLLRFCQRLHESNAHFRFRIFGNGAEAGAVEAWVANAADSRFSFGPFLEEDRFAAELHETDLFVITEKSGSGGSFIPCKMIAGISSGTPVWAVCDAQSPLGEEMRSHDLGPWLSWDNLDRAPAVAAEACAAPEKFAAWQNKAAARAIFYRRERLINEFEAALELLRKPQT
jgi:colanic acid biosynthesis glycosyl transferase WcaI